MSKILKNVASCFKRFVLYSLIIAISATITYKGLQHEPITEMSVVHAQELQVVATETEDVVVEEVTEELRPVERYNILFARPELPTFDFVEIDVNERLQKHINAGDFTKEDYLYLTSVAHEGFNSYEGFYAVGSCVLNRLKQNDDYNSIKDVVTANGQFTGFHDPYTDSKAYNKYLNDNVINAAIDLLCGGSSSVGSSYYFYGRVKGYDMWADGDISEFYVVDGNVFFNKSKGIKVHNKQSDRPANSILIYNHVTGEWLYDYYGG